MELRARLQTELSRTLGSEDPVAATAIRVAIAAIDAQPTADPRNVVADEITHLRSAAERLSVSGSPSATDAERQAAVLEAVLQLVGEPSS